MNTVLEAPPGATPYQLACAHCGDLIETHVSPDCDMTDPATVAMVNKIARTLKWLCRDCKDKFEVAHEKQRRWERSLEWAQICPLEFRQTLPERLPQPQLFYEAMKWKFGTRGRAMVGPTRKGKSRTAWKLAEREFLNGRDVKVAGSNFGILFAHKYTVSGTAAFEWMEELGRSELLLMDDVFKIKLTDAAEGALFNIVNHRTENGLPIIVTMNDSPETLKARMTADRGEALVRRLREFCEVITFN